QHGEERQVGERVAATLTAARVGDPVQGGEQAGERYHGGSSVGGWSPSTAHAPPRSVSPRCRPSRMPHAQHRTALESTGVYWIPVYEVLEQRGFTVVLVNARDAKHV